MNFWLLTTEYPPLHGGGISTYCFFTAQMFAEAGHSVTVFTQDDGISDYAITRESSSVRVIRFNSNRKNLLSVLGYTSRLSYNFAEMIKLIIAQEGKPDYIEAQDYLGIAYYLTQYKHAGYSFLSDVPIILTLHSPAFIYLKYNRVPIYRFPDFWTGEMEKQCIVAADLLISPTKFMVKEIQKHIVLSGKRIEYIGNPYRTNNLPQLTTSRNKIVYYGKLSPQKGSFRLLEYFKELWDDDFPYPLHVIGGTDIIYQPEMQTMGQLIQKKYALYIKKGLLLLHGKIKPAEIYVHLQDAHVLILPSIVDNLPYVVIEAMALGKILLVSKQGGQKEMLEENITGFMFDHEVEGNFSAQLQKILSLPEQRIAEIGKNARKTARETYSFDNIFQKKIDLLQQLKSESLNNQRFPFLYQEEIKLSPDQPTSDGLLSVVIPYYNMGTYIDECVQSVLDSSYKKIELLVINDGTTDPASLLKLDTLTTKGHNVSVVNRSNKGLAETRNYGANNARGEFLAFLDADDKVAPEYYEKAIRTLRQNTNVFFVGSWVQYFENSNGVWPAFTPQPPYALVHNPVNSSGLVYKRTAFLAGGSNDKKVDYGLEDYESIINMLRHGYNGVILPEVLFYYRVRTGSMSRDISAEKLIYSNAYICEKHKEYYAKFATQIINLLNANGPGYLFDNPTFGLKISSNVKHESLFILKLKKFIKSSEWLKTIALNFKKIRK